jgi:CPA2 family monovalent cation:H+ antiporter-2
VLAVVLIVLVGKSLASFVLVLAFRYSVHTALTISAALAQIGEFSFILAALGVSLGLLPAEAQSLIVAAAIITITLNPFVFRAVDPVWRWIGRHRGLTQALERPAGSIGSLPPGLDPETLHDHVVLVGHGRVGAPVADELALHGIPYVIIEQSRERAEQLRQDGLPVLYGDATRPDVLGPARLDRARMVLVAAPDAFEARAILELVRRLNPNVEVLVRTHSDEEREFLEQHGAERALVAERELAVSLTRAALRRFDVPHDMEQVAQRALHLAPRELRR